MVGSSTCPFCSISLYLTAQHTRDGRCGKVSGRAYTPDKSELVVATHKAVSCWLLCNTGGY